MLLAIRVPPVLVRAARLRVLGKALLHAAFRSVGGCGGASIRLGVRLYVHHRSAARNHAALCWLCGQRCNIA
jgi:hypothetical protein